MVRFLVYASSYCFSILYLSSRAHLNWHVIAIRVNVPLPVLSKVFQLDKCRSYVGKVEIELVCCALGSLLPFLSC